VAGSAVGGGVPAFLAERDVETGHATALRRLLDAGASVRGIARTDQFAYSSTLATLRLGTLRDRRSIVVRLLPAGLVDTAHFEGALGLLLPAPPAGAFLGSAVGICDLGLLPRSSESSVLAAVIAHPRA